MSRLGNISGKKAVRAFERAGWIFKGQVGSHVILIKQGEKANLSVPQNKELGIGILRKLIQHSGLSVDEFQDLLK